MWLVVLDRLVLVRTLWLELWEILKPEAFLEIELHFETEA